MKIYFTASITGRKSYQNEYDSIIKVLRDLGHAVETELDMRKNDDIRLDEPLEKREKMHKRIMKKIGSCEMVVVEASYPSTNIGYEIASAIDKEKPVLVIHVPWKVPVLLLGAKYDRLKIIECTPEDLKSNIKFYLDELGETVDTRFNFFISPKHQIYLDWVAKNKKIPRAVFLRRLIEDDMKRNEKIS